MKPFLVSEIRKLLDGTLIQGSDELLIRDAKYYSAMLNKPNSLLFAVKQKIDWGPIRKFSPCAVITDRVTEDLKSIDGCTIILVENVQTSYWKFVEYYRSLFQIPVVAVTGTSGKTTTKDMIKHILKSNFKVHGTNFSANGRPGHLTNLMGIDETTEVAVFETAIAAPGNILKSSKYFKPIIGIITNIGITHLDGCKTVESYIQAKGEMVTVLDKGILIVNADDENSKRIGLSKFKGRIVYFGIHSPSHFQASDIQYGANGMDFVLTFQNIKYQMFVPGYGEHQVYNALAAFAAVHEMGIGMKEAVEALRTFKNMRAHLQLLRGIGGCMILDDTWNSNPTSLRAAFQTLNGIAKGRKRVALIGDIKALGNMEVEVHSQVGDMITELGVDRLITVGSMAEVIGKQASKKGLKGEIHAFSTTEGVYRFLEQVLDRNTLILVKCSSKDIPIIDLVSKLKHVNVTDTNKTTY